MIGKGKAGFAVALIAAGLLIVAPASVYASTVSADSAGDASYVAGSGEANQVAFSYISNPPDQNQWRVIEIQWTSAPGATLTPGPNCAQSSPNSPNDITCSGGGTASFDLGDNDDILATTNGGHNVPLNVRASGGSGKDRLLAVPDGGQRNFDGGPGDDEMFFAVWIPSGTPTPLYQAFPGQYQLQGGEGNDAISGFWNNLGVGLTAGTTEIAESLDGGPGNDSVAAFGGNDNLQGGDGDDTALGGSGDDVIDAGTGNDQLAGGTGLDQLLAGDGDDIVDSIDDPAHGDNIDCGLGVDQVIADPVDSIPLSCERIGDLYQQCPYSATHCQGTITLASPMATSIAARPSTARKHRRRQLLGSDQFRIRRGKTGSPSALLSKRARKLVRRHGRMRIIVRVSTTIFKRGRAPKVIRHRGALTLQKTGE